MLIDEINGQLVQPRQILTQPSLIVRASSAAPCTDCM
jgi:DNA-binding LacI/PurR family transcriptional regulator